MLYGRMLTDLEVANLYIRHPKMFVEHPQIVIKNFKNSRLMFIVLDNKRYIIKENNKTKESKWYETNAKKD